MIRLMMLFAIAGLLVAGCAGSQDTLKTDADFKLKEYTGTWYEIARLPNRFQAGCSCVTATYTEQEDGKMKVHNQCVKLEKNGKVVEAKAKAFPMEDKNAAFQVQFVWPFRGDYYVLDVAKDHSYAVVGSPSREYLWILSREPFMEGGLYNRLVEDADCLGFPTKNLLVTNQSCNAEGFTVR